MEENSDPFQHVIGINDEIKTSQCTLFIQLHIQLDHYFLYERK